MMYLISLHDLDCAFGTNFEDDWDQMICNLLEEMELVFPKRKGQE